MPWYEKTQRFPHVLNVHILSFPSPQNTKALLLRIFAARLFWVHMQLAAKPEAVSDQTQNWFKIPHHALTVRMVGDLLCITYSRALCTFDPHCTTIGPAAVYSILITTCTSSPLGSQTRRRPLFQIITWNTQISGNVHNCEACARYPLSLCIPVERNPLCSIINVNTTWYIESLSHPAAANIQVHQMCKYNNTQHRHNLSSQTTSTTLAISSLFVYVY